MGIRITTKYVECKMIPCCCPIFLWLQANLTNLRGAAATWQITFQPDYPLALLPASLSPSLLFLKKSKLIKMQFTRNFKAEQPLKLIYPHWHEPKSVNHITNPLRRGRWQCVCNLHVACYVLSREGAIKTIWHTNG